jgi:L-threonylcarbamoyladenylate synthase
VVSLTRTPPAILRPGMITEEQLEAATGGRFEREVNLPRLEESPGQHPRHYAPRTRFYVLEPGASMPQGRGRVLEMPEDAHSFAAKLYADLHAADVEGWDWIAIRQPPERPEWAGILDRLRRASARDVGDASGF